MNKTLRLDLQRVQRRLGDTSDHVYLDMLRSLCKDHTSNPLIAEVYRLSGLLSERYDKLLAIQLLDVADSLADTTYPTATLHYVANQLAALIRKYPFDVDGLVDPEQAAFDKFVRSEALCRRMNILFKYHATGRKVRSIAPEYYLSRMRSFCTFVLGQTPDMSRVLERCGFGPGANVGVNGSATHVYRKISSRWSVSSGAFDLARAAISSHPQLREYLTPEHAGFSDGSPHDSAFVKAFREKTSLVEYNNLSFVPKTTKTFRSIAVEPLLNSYLQKGIDEEMRRLLRLRASIDLTDQATNSEMARSGSLDGEHDFVTIDLSSASDSIAREFVRDMLPPDWFYLLDRVRSKSYRYRESITDYEKFCSMGNGFCFPLQTLLFAAMCNAVGAGKSGIDFRVYGDDIVVRKQHAYAVLALLRQCGFRPNKGKTFLSGPFRESCGKDYYSGINVRPVYLDYKLDSLESYFKFFNSTITTNALSRAFFEDIRSSLFERVPLRWRFVALNGVTDSAFLVEKTDVRFLTSPHVRFSKRTWTWYWAELGHDPWVDFSTYDREREHICVLYGALLGLPSSKTFTFRRLSKAKVRVATHGVATSNWLPPPYA